MLLKREPPAWQTCTPPRAAAAWSCGCATPIRCVCVLTRLNKSVWKCRFGGRFLNVDREKTFLEADRERLAFATLSALSAQARPRLNWRTGDYNIMLDHQFPGLFRCISPRLGATPPHHADGQSKGDAGGIQTTTDIRTGEGHVR
uniref:Uncharacterized protein n=1 Tax=Alexandrium monilatum TaxID=311494 RepID=A0A7S4UY13_9DINO